MLPEGDGRLSKLDGEMDLYSTETRISFDKYPFPECNETIIVAEKCLMSCHTGFVSSSWLWVCQVPSTESTAGQDKGQSPQNMQVTPYD